MDGETVFKAEVHTGSTARSESVDAERDRRHERSQPEAIIHDIESVHTA